MNWINKHIENEVQKESQKSTSFAKEYGGFAFWGGIVGGVILGFVGGFFDAAVLYGIIFTWLQSHYWSLFMAVIFAVTIQLSMGWGIVKSTKSISLQQYQKSGFSYYLIVAVVISVSMTGISLYLSWNTDKLVGVIASPLFDEQKSDVQGIRTKYEGQAEHAEKVIREEIAALRKNADELAKDVIMYKGVLSVRENSMRTRNNILKNQIPKMERGLELRLAEIREFEKLEIEKAENKNASFDKDKFATIAAGGNTTKGANILLNLFRCLILISYTIFLTHSISELRDAENATTGNDNATTPKVNATTTTTTTTNKYNVVDNAENVVTTGVAADNVEQNATSKTLPLSLSQKTKFQTTERYIDYLLDVRAKKKRTLNAHKSKIDNGKGNVLTNTKAMQRNENHIHQIDLLLAAENADLKG